MMLLEWFWSPSIWLPPNYTWNDLKNSYEAGVRFPEFSALFYPIPCAVILLCIRYLVERYLFLPFGRSLGIDKEKKQPPPNPILEKYFISNQGCFRLDGPTLKRLSDSSQLSSRSIQRWFRKRSAVKRATKLTKFSESLWRASCYTINLVVGLVVLWNKPWLWDLSHCWSHYPFHDLTDDLQFYYLVGASLYTSFALSQFFDVQRKDFWEMFIHHVTTLLLLALSWMSNLVRVGSIVLFLHDCADVPLEYGKVSNYAKKNGVCEILFGTFVLIWVLTRLIYFPFYVLYSINFEAQNDIEIFPTFRILSYLLIVLFCLHMFWTWYIGKMIARAVNKGSSPADRDSRSSTDSSDSSSEDGAAASSRPDPSKNKIH